MAARIARISARHADRTLAGLAVLAAACGLIVASGEDRLTLGGSGSTVTPLVIRVSGPQPVRSGSYRVALEVMRSALRATPGVTGVTRGPIKGGGRVTSLTVTLTEDPKQSEQAVEQIETQLDPGPLRISFAGGANALPEARSDTYDDLRLMLLAVPLAALLLIAAQSPRGALATLFAGAATVLGAGALCIALSLLVDISVLSLVGAAAAGIPSSILLCGLARRGTGQPALAGAALASATCFGALALLGVPYLAAIALGGALASLLAAPTAIAAMSAAARLWGGGELRETAAQRLLARLALSIGWRRAVGTAIAILAVGTLAVVALPATRLEPGAFGASAPPAISLQRALIATGAGLVCLVIIGWVVGRRLPRAIVTALTVPLAPAAAAGLAVLVFQDGRLRDLLDFEPFTIGVGSLAAGAIAVAAASAGQGVATLADLRESPAGALPTLARLRRFTTVTGVAAAASGIAALLAASLLISSLAFVKTIGLLVAAGLVLDFLLVRLLVGPVMLGRLWRRAPEGGGPG